MKFGRLIFSTFVVGFISSILLVYFYTEQRDFTQKHRELLIYTNKISESQKELNNIILQSSMNAYVNQDKVASLNRAIYRYYNELKNSSILKKNKYNLINKEITALKTKIDKNIERINEYLMLNASVKNSLSFLTRYVEKAVYLKDKDKDLFINAYKILKNYHNTKDMQDIDYIYNNSLRLVTNSNDERTHSFVKSFNMHSDYLSKKYPKFIVIAKEIVNNNINNSINTIRTNFSKLSLTDFDELDLFASVLFSIFVFSLAIIVILLVKYMQENNKLLKIQKSLQHSLSFDQLTNLYNRTAFEDDVASLKTPHLLIINVDNFKNINDIYGNSIGNILLKDLAKLITVILRKVECKVYRLGGDEFGVLFSDIDSKIAFDNAVKLEYEISLYPFAIKDLELNIAVSIASNNVEPILENADLALKLIKGSRTKRVIEYEDNLNLTQDIKYNTKILNSIKSAIEDDRIVPFFQPIVDLQTDKIVKYEALVRLKEPDGNILSPYQFLDIAKKTHYYHDITEIMIIKTLKVAQEFPNLRFSINVSMIDILNDEFVNLLVENLKENESISSGLDIELLESEGLHDIAKVSDFINKVRKYGSKILIDDFGSGYANFSHFSELDIDIVKIDGSIVSGVTTNKRKLHMLKSIHNFTQGMKLDNIAEYVETKESANLLREIGVRYAQGYYFSKPLEYPLSSDEIRT